MAERPEDVSMVYQTSEPAMSDSDGKLDICCTSKKQTNNNILYLRVNVNMSTREN